MQEFTIWDSQIDLADWEDYFSDEEVLEAYGRELDEWEKYRIAEELNGDYLDDERMNLNIELPEDIVVIASLGLWNGRRGAYKLLRGNISNCLYPTYDFAKFYVDEKMDLCGQESHHDGTNYYTYRMWKPGISHTTRRNFLRKVIDGTVTRRDITRVTKRLGDYVNDVYGFYTPKTRKKSAAAAA